MQRLLAWIRSLFSDSRLPSPDAVNASLSYEALPLPATPKPPTSDEDIKERTPEQMAQMIADSEALVTQVNALYSVDTLSAPVREESVEEARKILRWLRNMEFTERDVEEWLDQGTPVVQSHKKKSLHNLVLIFTQHLAQLLKRNPEQAKRDPAILNARSAAASIALILAEHTRLLMEDDDPRMAKIDALIDSLPPDADLRCGQSLASLMETLELGMDSITGKQVGDLSTPERIVEMSKRIEATAYQLHSTQSLGEPAREESLELAREILRRMNASYESKQLNEMIDKSKPEEKAAFAQQASEMADMYKNLLSEAVDNNAEIRQTVGVKDANNAIANFAHAIKLMAAKEIPSSMAASQQISAEAASMPEAWKDMHQQLVGRLVKSAESGVEKAIEEIAQQQQEQQKQQQEQGEDVQQEAAEQQVETSKRKKKRRIGSSPQRSGKSGGGGGKKPRKPSHEAVTGEMYKQTRVVEEAKAVRAATAIPMAGLNADALAAALEAGGQVRNISAATTVSANDKIMADNKTAAERAIEKEKQKKQQGPLV